MPRRDIARFIDECRGKKAVVTNVLNDRARNDRIVRRMCYGNYGAAAFKFVV